MPRPHALAALLALPLATACGGGPQVKPCATESVTRRRVDADVAASTFELRVPADHGALPVRVEVAVDAAEPLLVVHSPAGAPRPDRGALDGAAVGVPLKDGSVVLARNTGRVQLQLAGTDVGGRLRFVRMAPRPAKLRVTGSVALVRAVPPEACEQRDREPDRDRERDRVSDGP